MVLTYHRSDFGKVPSEEEVMEALRPFNIPPGEYVIPHAESPKQMEEPEFKARMEKGPVAFLTFMAGGFETGKSLVMWFLYCILIGMFAAHIHAAFSLSRMNTKANKAYAGSRDYLAVNFASRTLRWTGPIILLYLLFHLADLTWGWFSDEWVRGDVYANVYNSMDALPIALIYIAANVALAVHIFHGAWSMFQTLGLNNPRYNNARRHFARGIAGLILIGNLSFPLAVQGGLVDLDGHTPGEYNLEYGD